MSKEVKRFMGEIPGMSPSVISGQKTPVLFPCKESHCDGKEAIILRTFQFESEFGYSGRQTQYQCVSCQTVSVVRH